MFGRLKCLIVKLHHLQRRPQLESRLQPGAAFLAGIGASEGRDCGADGALGWAKFFEKTCLGMVSGWQGPHGAPCAIEFSAYGAVNSEPAL